MDNIFDKIIEIVKEINRFHYVFHYDEYANPFISKTLCFIILEETTFKLWDRAIHIENINNIVRNYNIPQKLKLLFEEVLLIET